MSVDEKKPGLLRWLFGFRSREVPEKTPVIPKPPQPPASKPSRKKLSERRGPSKKDTKIPPAKAEAKLKGSPPAGGRQVKSARKAVEVHNGDLIVIGGLGDPKRKLRMLIRLTVSQAIGASVTELREIPCSKGGF